MADPKIAEKAPIAVEVKAGKTYFWCACGESKNQPFCDGSHQGGPFEPTAYKADEDMTVFFCACKQTGRAPLCDGSHTKL